VILKCTDISRSGGQLLEVMTQVTLQYTDSRKPCFSQDDMTKGNVLVLADALDEVPASEWLAVISRLREFHRDFPDCTIVLASRNYSSITRMPELNEFLRFDITPIDLRQAQNMLERLTRGKSLPVAQANEMLRQLHEVHGLELNPLLVTVFAATSDYARRDIPANITELFKKFTEMMLGRWDQKKGLAQQYQAVVKDFLLKRLGFHMHSNKLRSIALTNCKEIFSRELRDRGYEADVDVIFDEIVYRSGLFRIEDDSLVFRHALLQEFFAGRGVPSASFFEGVLSDERWKHPLVFYFGEHPEAHADLAALIETVNVYEGSQLYRAAVAVGLAVQACYLAKVSEKFESMHWVIDALARCETGVLQGYDEQNPKFPLSGFLAYYIFARDAVACEAVKQKLFLSAERMLKEAPTGDRDVRAFWHVVALIESGSLDKAELLVKGFRPEDIRLLLALHLGCFLIAHLRITSKEDRKIAKRICDTLAPKTGYLRKQVLDEMKSMLLEVRRGKIEALPLPQWEDEKPKRPYDETSPVKGRFDY
jgi:hypothetical protein